MLGSRITTFEGVVDLITGVWLKKIDKVGVGQTAGVDVRHC